MHAHSLFFLTANGLKEYYRLFMTLFLLLHKIYGCVQLTPIQFLLGMIEYDLGQNLLLESNNIVG